MRHEGSPIGWISGGTGGHLVGDRVQLMSEDGGEIVFGDRSRQMLAVMRCSSTTSRQPSIQR